MNPQRTLRRQQDNATKILLCIVLVFLILHIPHVVFRCMLFLGYMKADKWHLVIPVSRLALTINSSVNFVIYCMVGKKFRRELVQVFQYNKTTLLITTQSQVMVEEQFSLEGYVKSWYQYVITVHHTRLIQSNSMEREPYCSLLSVLKKSPGTELQTLYLFVCVLAHVVPAIAKQHKEMARSYILLLCQSDKIMLQWANFVTLSRQQRYFLRAPTLKFVFLSKRQRNISSFFEGVGLFWRPKENTSNCFLLICQGNKERNAP